jgi:hypothetical protein
MASGSPDNTGFGLQLESDDDNTAAAVEHVDGITDAVSA